jgi:hypothetical protein
MADAVSNTTPQRGAPSGASLDSILDQAAAMWREFRADHPYVSMIGMGPVASAPSEQERAEAIDRIEAVVLPTDDATLRVLAVDDRVWEHPSAFEAETLPEMAKGIVQELIWAVCTRIDKPQRAAS